MQPSLDDCNEIGPTSVLTTSQYVEFVNFGHQQENVLYY